MNAPFLRLFGYRRGELEGCNVMKIMVGGGSWRGPPAGWGERVGACASQAAAWWVSSSLPALAISHRLAASSASAQLLRSPTPSRRSTTVRGGGRGCRLAGLRAACGSQPVAAALCCLLPSSPPIHPGPCIAHPRTPPTPGYLRNYATSRVPRILDTSREVVALHKHRYVFGVQLCVTPVTLGGAAAAAAWWPGGQPGCAGPALPACLPPAHLRRSTVSHLTPLPSQAPSASWASSRASPPTTAWPPVRDRARQGGSRVAILQPISARSRPA